MDGKRLIERIRLTNFLTFGSEGVEIALEPLNVLIGPNLSGKSNFLEAISLLEALPQAAIRSSGGMSEWLWKGGEPSPVAEVASTIAYPDGPESLRHRFCFSALKERLVLVDESISTIPRPGIEPEYFYRFETGLGLIEISSPAAFGTPDAQRTHEMLPPESIRTNQSILHQLRDPIRYPELTYLASQFAQIGLYVEGWSREASKPPRIPVAADEPEDYLLESGSNLALVLNNLFTSPARKADLLGRLKRFNERIEDISLRVRGGVVGIEFYERGLNGPVSARHISDGTLRFLMLLAILDHPSPPPLVCIEEPEHGLHPDALHLVADLLRDASQRCQLIVTTHSDILVSALSDLPEAIIVCERDDAGTHLRRLEGAHLTDWLEKYTLGELWQMGEIGGRQ
ncbi:MAG TPA: AAA family ATPase [Pirellulales bacterium]|nr:AAA family ATPase [Pirellulales bacterium]